VSHSRYRRTVKVCNERGLHARAAARFVTLAETFAAEIEVVRGDTAVPGRSIMGLMMLGAGPGTPLEIVTWGNQAEVALVALSQLVEGGFEEN